MSGSADGPGVDQYYLGVRCTDVRGATLSMAAPGLRNRLHGYPRQEPCLRLHEGGISVGRPGEVGWQAIWDASCVICTVQPVRSDD
jgi:hypothetical protein